MTKYSIKDLERLSGIKAHTIRIWEKRYGLFKPKRTSTNIRYYDDDQVRTLLNVATLIEHGQKISRIAKHSNEEIYQQIDALIEQSGHEDPPTNAIINQIIQAGLTYNEPLFEKAFSNALLRYNIEDVYSKIICPALVRIGLMWSKEGIMPSQEHFISNLIRQKLCASIDAIPISTKPIDTWLLFLPEREDHEIGLLMASFLLKKHHRAVIYLGQRVPYSNIISAAQNTPPDHILFFITHRQPMSSLQRLIEKIKKDFASSNVWISGQQAIDNSSMVSNQCHLLQNIQEFIKEIKE